jgi:hypothetical protein
LPSACSFIVDVHCLTFSCRCSTLHVSAYMAIFKCVGYVNFHMTEGFCSSAFLPFFHVVTVCTFPSVGWVKYDILLFIITYAIFLFCYSIYK